MVLLAATNRPWDLDEAILRRLSKRIYIPLPTKDSRLELFKNYLSNIKVSNNIDYDLLINKTDGYNAEDIYNICKEASL